MTQTWGRERVGRTMRAYLKGRHACSTERWCGFPRLSLGPRVRPEQRITADVQVSHERGITSIALPPGLRQRWVELVRRGATDPPQA